MSTKPRFTAVVIGATGLTGRALIDLLAADDRCARVVAVVRQPVPTWPAKVMALRGDFEAWAKPGQGASELAAQLKSLLPSEPGAATGAPSPSPIHAFCCLGTTIKTAGSQAAFRQVDFTYVRMFAQAMRLVGAAHLGVVSALGASQGSSNFYLRTKGEMEQAVKAAGLPSLHLVRPSLIDGQRRESRAGESLALVVGRWMQPLLIGPLRPYRVVHANRIVARLVEVAVQCPPGVRVTESQQI